MDGSGCKNCPAYQKCTAQYMSSRCAHNRATYGVESDPFTNADRIRAMSDEELALFVRAIISTQDCPMDGMDCDDCFFKEVCWHESEWYGKEVEWIKQPADDTQNGE